MAIYLNISNEKDSANVVPITSNGKLAWVLSDLHLAAGLNENGNYRGTENFYYDQYCHQPEQKKPTLKGCSAGTTMPAALIP